MQEKNILSNYIFAVQTIDDNCSTITIGNNTFYYVDVSIQHKPFWDQHRYEAGSPHPQTIVDLLPSFLQEEYGTSVFKAATLDIQEIITELEQLGLVYSNEIAHHFNLRAADPYVPETPFYIKP